MREMNAYLLPIKVFPFKNNGNEISINLVNSVLKFSYDDLYIKIKAMKDGKSKQVEGECIFESQRNCLFTLFLWP